MSLISLDIIPGRYTPYLGIMCICHPPCAMSPSLHALVLGVGAEDVGVTWEDVSMMSRASDVLGELTSIENGHDRAAEELTTG
jgi:hypothetical protein